MNVTANFDISSQDRKAYLDSFGETPGENVNDSIEEKTEIDAEIDLLSETESVAPVIVEARATLDLPSMEETTPPK